MKPYMGFEHVQPDHYAGTLPDCPACDLMQDHEDMKGADRVISAHLKRCTDCQPMGSDPKFCATIQPTVTRHDELAALFDALAEQRG